MQDPHSKNKPTQTNQSSDKLLTMIEVMAENPGPMRLQDIAACCNTNSTTALRFITALQRKNYVAQEIDTGRYYLTLKLCAIGQSISQYMDIRAVSLPFLRGTSQLFRESCNLAIANDHSIMYIETANSPNQTLLSTQRIGNVAPMHCTGIGKLILSDYSPAELERFVTAKTLPRLTDFTITDQQALSDELEQIRRQGYAFDNEECEVGARCIAAPIRDYTGRVIAGISVAGPAVRMTDEHIYQHLPYLLDTARQISIRMGWLEAEHSNA
ncbi:IclR family transcriptional regulator [Ruminococcaceae bacterium OttesenSCG-928-L11]|nr:IclR family transcriptional regulator [Ruminococcaceae bacterium OttesenSCG-928-L11]